MDFNETSMSRRYHPTKKRIIAVSCESNNMFRLKRREIPKHVSFHSLVLNSLLVSLFHIASFCGRTVLRRILLSFYAQILYIQFFF